MILKEADSKEIENQARKDGLITMKQDGYLKVLEGITTIEEILRVAEV
jgi:type II secretory ATPase GspE/PulE/Tfp pilus assembly ATPase PilB-like protein